ncbi:LPS assembly protein LptD [Cognatilysobacter bugurensis]|uniref:LPS-assembly protein LptD n=1 Tax=Cognatilysobacter bugurensis TaxID=543356 RepID=A0A918T3R0_9GAMM|nr:LPS assembly protein LptD [Lysobacter bugurensis]GHA89856.1 LPS-assembly protein LptD [Lysobacter bugurensis]
MRPTFRLLPLSLCIALALPATAADNEPEDFRLCPIRDSVPAFDDAQAPVGNADIRAAQPTDIEGDELEGQDERSTLVQGNVRLQRGDQFLGTDKLTFNSETGEYTAEGSVRYQDSGMRIVAKRAEGNQEADTHRITDLSYQLTERRGSGGADRIELKGDHGALIGATYSTCDPAQRVWELEADRIDIDTEEGLGVARGAKLRIGKVPVLYVPWFMFPVDDRRRTGLLYPSISMSSRNGFDWRQPIYFNLAPNYDATLYPRLMSERGVALGSEFRWLYPQGQGTVAGTFMPSDRLPENDPDRYQVRDANGNLVRDPNPPDENRGQFALNALHTLGSKWYAAANLGWVSDTHYLEDFSNSLYGVATYFIRSDVGAYGRGRNWEASITADHYQLSDYTLSEANLPFDRLPRAYAHWGQPFFDDLLEIGIDGEAVRFEHEVFDAGSRIDIKPYAAMSLEGAAWFVRPKVAWRYTGYDLEPGRARAIAVPRAAAALGIRAENLTDEQIRSFYDATPSRSVPISSLDMGVYFDRTAAIRGERYLQTLEPRLYYLRVPYEDQSDLPLFDTSPMTFSWGQLFRDNRYTGPDRQTDANQLTVALTSRLISEDDGRERLAASIGQIHYLDESRVTLDPAQAIAVERGRSAWVADLSVSPNDRWTINAAYQWDPKFRREDLAALRARYLFGDAGIVNIGYRYRRDLLEQVDFSFVYPFNRNWSFVGRYYYSLLERPDPVSPIEAGPLETIAGVQWESCCLAVRVLGRRYLRDRSGELNNSLQLEVELKGLGSAGQKAERVLRRAILGYDRDDLYLVPPSSVNRPGVDGTAAPSSDPTL